VTDAKPDYYHLLGVSCTATTREIECAFQSLEHEFHAAGKPKDIDDVESLRRLKKAHDVLGDANRRAIYDRMGDDFQSDRDPSFGYDAAAIKDANSQVDNEIKTRRNYWLAKLILRFLGFDFK
jgi:DnaJ-class molecular chaperone